jgi:hypothetical protein
MKGARENKRTKKKKTGEASRISTPAKSQPSMSVEDAITQTANRARGLLFDREGKPKGIDHYLASLTLHTLIRPAKWFGQTDLAKPDILVFKWCGDMMIYDPGLAEIFFSECSDPYCDRLLCNAAAMILQATGGIADKRLRDYACRRWSGDMPPPPVKPPRGRSADDNRLRNACIVGYLIPPLLVAEFPSTRNEATETESACSIVSQALATIEIELGEKHIAKIWAGNPLRDILGAQRDI